MTATTPAGRPEPERDRLRSAVAELTGQSARLVHTDTALALPLAGLAADLAACLAHAPSVGLWTAVPLTGLYLLAVLVHALTCRSCPNRKEGSS